MTIRTPRSTPLAAALLAAVVSLTGCTSDGEESATPTGAEDAAGGQAAYQADTAESADRSASSTGAAGGAQAAQQRVLDRAVISTGEVSLRSDDVAQARQEVHSVVRRFGGRIDEDTTETDDDGTVSHAHLVLRVPSESFPETVAEVEAAAELVSSSTHHEDVTTQVIDVEVRVSAQRRSIQRIEELLDRAGSIRDIVRVESELTRRQANLASLEQQQEYLADQTSMSTLTVTIWRPDQPQAETERTGFVGGLGDGWAALTASAVVLLTVLGAVLPWLPVLALLVLPLWLWRRRRVSAGGSARTPSDASADQDPSTE